MNKISEYGEVAVYEVELTENTATGVEIEVPGSNLKELQIRCDHGFLLCGFFDVDVFTAKEIPAAIISASNLVEMLKNKPKALSEPAIAKGATLDMTGQELAELFSN